MNNDTGVTLTVMSEATYQGRASTNRGKVRAVTEASQPTDISKLKAFLGLVNYWLIGYVSRSLTPAERMFTKINQEALAIIFGVKKFHQYLYGRKSLSYTQTTSLRCTS